MNDILTTLAIGLSALAGFLHVPPIESQNLGAQSALTTFQGGTGSTSPSGILIGDSSIRLKTLTIGSNLSLVGTTLSATGTAFPFTPTQNYGALTNATGTPVWFQAGLQASSTSRLQTLEIHPSATDLYGINVHPADGFYDVYNAFFRITDEDGVDIFNVDSGGYDMTAPSGGTVHALLRETDNTNQTTLDSALGLNIYNGALGTVAVIGPVTGLRLGGFTPSEAAAANTVQTYYDGTIGAPGLIFRGKALDATGFTAKLDFTNLLSTSRTFTFPNQSGTLCLVGVACDGAGTWPWSPQTYHGLTYQATSSNMMASSTIAVNATTTNATTTNLNVSGQLDIDGLTSALILTGVTGVTAEYGGAAACTNQFVTALSVVGATTCASINNDQWSGTDLSVANGGTGASTLTDGGVLLGSGTGAVTAMSVLADGSIIVGDGTTAPVALAAFESSTGDLAVTAGGTGVGTLTGLLLGNGTSDITGVTGTVGQFPYFNGTNTVLATSSIFLSTSGNVGFGTTSPNVSGFAAGNRVLTIQGGTGRAVLELNNPSAGTGGTAGTVSFNNDSTQLAAFNAAADGAINSGKFAIFTNNAGSFTEKMTVTSSGSVGFGDTTPDYLLDVAGTGGFDGLLTMTGTAANIALGSNYLSGDGGDEGVFVDSTGNVGLGTSTPIWKLTAVDETNSGLTIYSQGNSASFVFRTGDTAAGNRNFAIRNRYNAVGTFEIDRSTTIGGDPVTPMLRFDNAGDAYFVGELGVGNIDPGFTLDVNGTAAFRNLSASGVGDTYVCLATTKELRTGATCAASTQRIKEAIKPVQGALAELMRLNPVTFNYKKGFYNQRKDIGFLAEEVSNVNPQFAFYEANGKPYGLNTSAILSTTVKSVQELNAKVLAQQKTIDTLVKRLELLEKKK